MPDYSAGRDAVAVWGERWLASKAPTWKPTTPREAERLWRSRGLPTFGARRVRTVTPADVQDWAADLPGPGLSPHSVPRHVNVLRQVLGAAVRARALDSNPAGDVPLPTDQAVGRLPYEPSFLTAEQVKDIAQALDAVPPYGLLVQFTAWTGLRAG